MRCELLLFILILFEGQFFFLHFFLGLMLPLLPAPRHSYTHTHFAERMQRSWWPVEHVLRPLAPDSPHGPEGQGALLGLLIGSYEGKCRPADIRKNKQSGTHSLVSLWHSPSLHVSFKCSVGTIERHQSSRFTLPCACVAHTQSTAVSQRCGGLKHVAGRWKLESLFVITHLSLCVCTPHPASFCLSLHHPLPEGASLTTEGCSTTGGPLSHFELPFIFAFVSLSLFLRKTHKRSETCKESCWGSI